MKYCIQKSEIPIIFIDTFMLIDILKHENGLIEDKRVSDLFVILKDKVSSGKIICPIANQEEEIDEHVSNTMKAFIPISLGIRFDTSFDIQMKQFCQMVEIYRDNIDQFSITYKDAFSYDIDEEFKRKRMNDLLISVVLEPSEQDIKNRKISKQNNLMELQKFMDSEYNSRDFEAQLDDEFTGIYQATRFIVHNVSQKIDKGIELTEQEWSQYQSLFIIPFLNWSRCIQEKNGIRDFLEFLLTDHYKCIPHEDINTRLITDIVVSKKSFESGDSQDISNISTLLPYCDFIITDKAVMNRVQRLGLDKKYNTELYCMKNIDLLISKLDRI